MKILIIANACPWPSWDEKIAAIKTFWAPLVELEIDVKYTDFTGIPTAQYPGTVTQFPPTGAVDVAGENMEIDQAWFAANIGPLIAGYDVAVFQTTAPNGGGLPLGIKFEELNGTWCCETFVLGESDNYYLPGMIELGNSAEIIIEHEISHALYSISGQPDRTHEFFYANQFTRVLTDIKLPDQSAIVSLYQQVIAALEEELGIIKANKAAAADMNTSTVTVPEFPATITKWAVAIGKSEGANPKWHNMGNLKYSTLTASWGATKGFQATDDGWIAAFPDDQTGETALGNFLMLGCENELLAFHSPEARTLDGFTKIYAGNPKQDYYDVIHAELGLPGDTQISTFIA